MFRACRAISDSWRGFSRWVRRRTSFSRCLAGDRYIRRFVPEGQDLEVVELSDTPTGPGPARVVDLNAMRVGRAVADGGICAVEQRQAWPSFAHTAGGREKPIVQLVEVETGKVLSQGLPSERLGTFTWLPDDSGFFYMSMDPADIRAGKTLFRVMVDATQWRSWRTSSPAISMCGRWLRRTSSCPAVRQIISHPGRSSSSIRKGAGTWKPFLKDMKGIFRGDIVGERFFAITDDGAPARQDGCDPARHCPPA